MFCVLSNKNFHLVCVQRSQVYFAVDKFVHLAIFVILTWGYYCVHSWGKEGWCLDSFFYVSVVWGLSVGCLIDWTCIVDCLLSLLYSYLDAEYAATWVVLRSDCGRQFIQHIFLDKTEIAVLHLVQYFHKILSTDILGPPFAPFAVCMLISVHAPLITCEQLQVQVLLPPNCFKSSDQWCTWLHIQCSVKASVCLTPSRGFNSNISQPAKTWQVICSVEITWTVLKPQSMIEWLQMHLLSQW